MIKSLAVHDTAFTSAGAPSKAARKPEGRLFELDAALRWRGWHAFQRGLATRLHSLRVDGKAILAILWHSNIGLTMNVYVRSVAESGVNAMHLRGAEPRKIETCNNLVTNRSAVLN